MKEVYNFLKDLKKNNNREWFNANKERYLAAKAEVDAFTQQLIDAIATIEPEAASLTPADCTYRIYRDIRFSADKTPYKTYIGIFICPGGNKKSRRCGYYVHIEPCASMVAGGCWCPNGPLLKAIRESIYDNVDEYLEIINAPQFREKIKEVGCNPLKTMPKGFPKDWEHIDLLKPRDYTVYTTLSDSVIKSADRVAAIMSYFRAIHPYNAFINYLFDEDPALATW